VDCQASNEGIVVGVLGLTQESAILCGQPANNCGLLPQIRHFCVTYAGVRNPLRTARK